MNAWIEFLGLWLADFYLAATILLTIAAILFTVIRQPAPRMAVGWGSLLGLLIAAGLCLSPSRPRFDLRPFFTRPATPVAETEPASVPIASPPVVETAAPRPDETEERALDRFEPTQLPVEQLVRTDAPTTEPVSSAPPAVAWGPRFAALAVGLFLAGLVAMASWLLVGVLRASRLVQRSAPAPDGCCDELRRIAGRAARLPRLRMNRRLVMPVATGTLRPAILLPQGFAETGSRNALKAVLAHEWTHIKNGDLWLLAVDRLVLSLLWAHPLYWWTRRRIRTNQEFLADAAAASQIGPTDYAALLVEWARNLAAHRSLTALTAVGIWERPAALEQRVREILNQNHASPRCTGRVSGVLLVCLAGLGLIATSLSLRPPLAESAPPSASSVATPIVQNPLPDSAPSTAAKSRLLPVERPNSLGGEIVLEHGLQSDSANDSKAGEGRIGKDDIGGACADNAKAPVVGAQISLYRVNFFEFVQQLVQRTSTDSAGRFRFGGVLANAEADRDRFVVVVRKDGFASIVRSVSPDKNEMHLSMRPAVTMQGTVRNQRGEPVADALVEVGPGGVGSVLPGTIEGVRSARTNVWGEFVVRDLPEFHYARPEPPPGWRGGWGTFGPPWMSVIHGDYVRTHVEYKDVPGRVDVVLSGPPATIEGQVVSAQSGKPVAGVLLRIKSAQPKDAIWDAVQTAADGRYRFASLPEGKFSIWASHAPGGQMADPIESLKIHPGQTAQAPSIRMVNGGVLQGRVTDGRTGRPAVGVRLVLQGIDHQSGLAYSFDNTAKTNADGEYRFTGLPTGKFNVLYREGDPNVTAVAIDSLEVRPPQLVTAPPIRLIAGCLIRGRIIDDAVGTQLTLRDGEHLDLQSHGPARPNSGAAVSVADVRTDGTFEIRLPPGKAWLAVRGRPPFEDGPNSGGDLTVPESGELKVEYHVRRYTLPKPGVETRPTPPKMVTQTADSESTKIVDYHVAKDEIGGLCMSQDEFHLAGVEVALYLASFGGSADDSGLKLIEKVATNSQGQYVFRHVPEMDHLDEYYLILARQQGRMTVSKTLNHRHDWLDLKMWWSQPFKGTVKDADGKPVVGALVRCDDGAIYQLPEGIQSTRTNPRGEFQIDDVAGVGNCVIEHPDYARRTLNRVPFHKAVELTLARGGIAEGQVVDTVTGKPPAALSVRMQPIDRTSPDDASWFHASVKTDSQGRYRIGSIPTGNFNVFVSSVPGRASIALDSLAVAAGRIVPVPPIRLVKGGMVKGRLINDATGEPALVGEDERVRIGVHGPSRPRSGAAIEGFAVKTDGTFELRLPPGKNFVYLSGGPFLVRKPGDPYASQDIREINVKEGEETTIEFRVTRQVPMKKAPANRTKKSPVPTSGAVNRSAPIAVAEAPNFSPKIVDYQVGKDEIAGLCIGQGEARLAAVDVSLYVDRFGGAVEQRSQRLFGRTTTNSDGQFLFQHVPQVNPRAERFFVIAHRQDLATALETLDHRHDWVELNMRASHELKGTVKDTQGHPVADAFVRCDQSTFYKLPEGVKSTRTNARGEFEIDDVSGVGRCIVEHSGYPRKVLNGPEITDPFDIILDKRSAAIEGRVMSETGDSMAGLIVGLQGIDGQNEHATRFYSQAKTDQEGRYQLRSLPPGKFNVCVMSSLGEGVGLALDSIEVGPDQKTQAPALRIVKGGVVKGRLIDDATGGPAVLGKDERVSIGVHGPSRPRSGGGIEAFPVKSDGSFEMRLPPGQNDVFVIGGGPFFVRDADNHYTTQSFQVVDVKVGEEATIEFHVLRDAPPKKVPDEATRKSPTPSSAALSRPAPVAMAEAPNVSPKIVDYHLARSMKRKNAAPEQRSEIVRPSPKEVLGYLPTNVAKWLASGPPTNRDRMRVSFEPAIDRTGECRFYPLVGRARLQQCVFKCSVALDKVPHADAPLDIQETIKAPLVFYMQQNHLICCDDSVAQR